MNVGAVAVGTSVVLLAVGILYATRNLLPRTEIPDGVAAYIRLLTALLAGVAITLGLLVALFGLIGG